MKLFLFNRVVASAIVAGFLANLAFAYIRPWLDKVFARISGSWALYVKWQEAALQNRSPI